MSSRRIAGRRWAPRCSVGLRRLAAEGAPDVFGQAPGVAGENVAVELRPGIARGVGEAVLPVAQRMADFCDVVVVGPEAARFVEGGDGGADIALDQGFEAAPLGGRGTFGTAAAGDRKSTRLNSSH